METVTAVEMMDVFDEIEQEYGCCFDPAIDKQGYHLLTKTKNETPIEYDLTMDHFDMKRFIKLLRAIPAKLEYSIIKSVITTYRVYTDSEIDDETDEYIAYMGTVVADTIERLGGEVDNV